MRLLRSGVSSGSAWQPLFALVADHIGRVTSWLNAGWPIKKPKFCEVLVLVGFDSIIKDPCERNAENFVLDTAPTPVAASPVAGLEAMKRPRPPSFPSATTNGMPDSAILEATTATR